MTPDERDDLVDHLLMLGELLNEPLGDKRMAGYCLALDGIDHDVLVVALSRCARECKFFPKPAEVIEFARSEKHRRQLEADEELRARLRARRALDVADEPQALPAHEPEAEPVMTAEAREAGMVMLRRAMQATLDKMAMPEPRRGSR